MDMVYVVGTIIGSEIRHVILRLSCDVRIWEHVF